MPWGIALGAIGGGLISGMGAKSAANTAAAAQDRAAQLEYEQWLQGRQDLSPYREVAVGEEIRSFDQAAYDRAMADYYAALDTYNAYDPSARPSFSDRWAGDGGVAPVAPTKPVMPTKDDYYGDVTGYTGGTLQELAGFGRSQVDPSQYIPPSNIPEFDAAGFNIDFWKDPSYEWRKQEMQRGIDRAAGSMGKTVSGNRLEEIMKRTGEMASQEYGAAFGRYQDQYAADVAREADLYRRGVGEYGLAYGEEGDYLNRLASLSNLGQTSTDLTARLGTASAASQADRVAASGAASAAGTIGATGAWGNALADIGYGVGQYMNRPAGGAAAVPPNINYSPVPPTTTYQDLYWR